LNVKLPSPVVETGIAVSVILLGLLLAIRRQLPPIYVAIPVAFFGIFHGRAHGTEIRASSTRFYTHLAS
jgi:urease accessory protein